MNFVLVTLVCSGSVVVTAYDFESTCPGSNPEWGPIYYKASITAQGLSEPSSLRCSTTVPEQLNIKAVTGACKLIDGCSLVFALFSATVFSGIYATEIKSIQLHASIEGLSQKIVSSTT